MDELNRIIILSLLTDLIECSVLSICDDSSVFCPIIYASLSLLHSSTPPFGRPSASSDFLYSLTSSHYACCISLCSVQNTTPEDVLSLCCCSLTLTLTTSQGYMVGCGCHESSDQSRSSQGYLAWCGCHEILIQRCITVLFLLNSSVYLIQLWFWWLSYSNHSFQLISIQDSVHHSD